MEIVEGNKDEVEKRKGTKDRNRGSEIKNDPGQTRPDQTRPDRKWATHDLSLLTKPKRVNGVRVSGV